MYIVIFLQPNLYHISDYVSDNFNLHHCAVEFSYLIGQKVLILFSITAALTHV